MTLNDILAITSSFHFPNARDITEFLFIFLCYFMLRKSKMALCHSAKRGVHRVFKEDTVLYNYG